MADDDPKHPIKMIQCHLIQIGDQQIREPGDDEEIAELALDLQRRGQLQAIGVSPLGRNRYQLRWGSRRLRAAMRLRWTLIEAKIVPADDKGIRSTAAAENLIRRQLSLAEECHAVQLMTDADQMSPNEIAAATGKTREWVLRRLAVPQLPVDLQDALLNGHIKLAHVEHLALVEDHDQRTMLTNAVKQQLWTVSQLREAIRSLQTLPGVQEAVDHAIEQNRVQVLPVQALLPCQVCGAPHRPAELIMIRVCADGCPTPPHQAKPETTDPASMERSSPQHAGAGSTR